ncbi:MAG: hypothetical protein ACC700_15765 [Anaerolineales bacterium]
MSSQIRVDPGLLRQMAEELARAAQIMLGAATRIESEVGGASGYDGQLYAQVAGIAGGDSKAVILLAEELAQQCEDMKRIAEGFAEADSLEMSGRLVLAATIRSVVDDGYDTSAIPQWLMRRSRPPWINPRLWARLPEEDRLAILQSLERKWLDYVDGPMRGEYRPGTRFDEGFIIYLYLQGVISTTPAMGVWESAAQASGMTLAGYISVGTGIRQPQVEGWLRAAETHDFDPAIAVEEMARMTRTGGSVETYFDFEMEGNWTEADEDAIVGGMLMVSYALAGATLAADSPHTVFASVFDDVVFTLKEEGLEQSWYCSAGGYGWRCEPLARGRMSAELLAHELGHTFNARVNNRLTAEIQDSEDPVRQEQLLAQVPSMTPYGELGRTQIAAEIDGETVHVSGRPPAGGYERTDLGFASLGKPWQQHSIRWDEIGNTANEDFADMFLGWGFDGFGDDSAGEARYTWMEANMPEWIAQASEPLDLTWFDTADP